MQEGRLSSCRVNKSMGIKWDRQGGKKRDYGQEWQAVKWEENWLERWVEAGCRLLDTAEESSLFVQWEKFGLR